MIARGTYSGMPTVTWRAPRLYDLKLEVPPFSYTTSYGQLIVPMGLTTDGGTIPRFFWALPDLAPWTYFPAYVIHDFCFLRHHQGRDIADFVQSASILREAIWTLVEDGLAPGDLAVVEAIYVAVMSPIALALWKGES